MARVLPGVCTGSRLAGRDSTGRDIGTYRLTPLSLWVARHRPPLVVRRLPKSLINALFLRVGVTTAGQCLPVTAERPAPARLLRPPGREAAGISPDQGVGQGLSRALPPCREGDCGVTHRGSAEGNRNDRAYHQPAAWQEPRTGGA